MTITLGGIALPNNLHLKSPYQWSGIAGSVDRSLGGGLIVWENELLGGEPLDLVGDEGSGWIALPIVEQLHALVSLAGAEYELNYRMKLYTVRFRQEDAPALELIPLITELEFESGSYYHGRIKLMSID
ncbi:MAG: hypothetical protein U9R60_17885 [Bacteroidota bacterium]|nr:hypothetical protein [Bacteroidota bacterium]